MNEEPKSIGKKLTQNVSWMQVWLALTATTFVIDIAVIMSGKGGPTGFGAWLVFLFLVLVFSAVFAAVILFLCWFIRWLCSARHFKQTLFALACFATLIALFYAEEDWRGWHEWNRFETEWTAKGEKFDIASVVPPSVPDDQNFAMTPIWVESMKAQLGPERARQWFGDQYAENGRTNFIYRLGMDIYRPNPDSEHSKPNPGNWQKSELTDLKAWQDYYRAPAPGRHTNEFPTAPQPQTPAADVLLALGKYDAVIEELRQASLRPYARFPLPYDEDLPAGIILPHLGPLKQGAQILQLRAVAELQNGQSEQALADVKLALRLTGALRLEPFLISHLVEIAICQITLQPVYEGLAEHRWSDPQLAALEAELAKLDLLADYQVAMRGEMVFCEIGNIDYFRRHPEQILNYGGLLSEGGDHNQSSLPGKIASRSIPSGWFYQNELRCVRMMTQFVVPVADVNQATVSPAAVRHANEVLDAETAAMTPYNVLERMMLPNMSSSVKKFAQAQAAVDLARTAIALERFRLAHGEFPESLEALTPQFLAQAPHDVIGPAVQPLKYRRTNDGQFVLYSVGWNEKDDGGVVVFRKNSHRGVNRDNESPTSRVDPDQGDWVWQYPK